jgi:hypothetical protein
LSTERQRKYFEPEARLSKRNLAKLNGAVSRCTACQPITSLLPKDNLEAAGHVKQLYAMLEATIMTDSMLVQEVRR